MSRSSATPLSQLVTRAIAGLILRSPVRLDAGDILGGEVARYRFQNSQGFPGTVRDDWIYVPRQDNPAQPACLYVNQDGIQFNAPAVFDELIHRNEIPILIGVFVMPGRVPAPSSQAQDRFNRSYEYDSLGDAYARFLIEELLPEVERKSTADGRPIRLSHAANDRYAACDHRIYRRKVRTKGALAFEQPFLPPTPRLSRKTDPSNSTPTPPVERCGVAKPV